MLFFQKSLEACTSCAGRQFLSCYSLLLPALAILFPWQPQRRFNILFPWQAGGRGGLQLLPLPAVHQGGARGPEPSSTWRRGCVLFLGPAGELDGIPVLAQHVCHTCPWIGSALCCTQQLPCGSHSSHGNEELMNKKCCQMVTGGIRCFMGFPLRVLGFGMAVVLGRDFSW